MKIIAMRHGETEDNRRGTLRGGPKQGLTKVGREQVRKGALQLKNEHIDMIYSSDLRRCAETTEAIKQYHANILPVFTPRLRELGGGKMSKLPLWLPPLLVVPVLSLALRFNLRVPGGESWQGLRVRVKDFLNELYNTHPEATILLVTHGITIQAIDNLLKTPGNKKSLGKVISNGVILRFNMNDHIGDII